MPNNRPKSTPWLSLGASLLFWIMSAIVCVAGFWAIAVAILSGLV